MEIVKEDLKIIMEYMPPSKCKELYINCGNPDASILHARENLVLKETEHGVFHINTVDNSTMEFAGYMTFLFKDFSMLNKLKVGNVDTSSVKSMEGMFYDCIALEEADLSNFNMSYVIDVEHMFQGCSSLVNLKLDLDNLPMIAYTDNIFKKCKKLKGYSVDPLARYRHLIPESMSDEEAIKTLKSMGIEI